MHRESLLTLRDLTSNRLNNTYNEESRDKLAQTILAYNKRRRKRAFKKIEFNNNEQSSPLVTSMKIINIYIRLSIYS